MLLVLLGIFTQYGCNENILINSKISPSSDTLGVFQKYLTLITHTYYDDSITTSTNYPGIPCYQAVGNFTDPYFGSINAATYFQIIPFENGFTFAAADTIDSVVLVLPYAGFTWGDSSNQNSSQTFQVFYMNDSMGDISTASYLPSATKAIDVNTPLSAPTTINTYHLMDSFAVSGKNHSGLRLKLNTTNFMNRLNYALNTSSASGNPTESLFISYFNGICIKAADSRKTENALPYFRLDGSDPYSEAGVLVYYHVNVGDTTYAQFYFNSTYCTHFNSINNSYGHYPINNLYHSVAKNDAIIALQNQPGAGIDLYVVGIKSLPQGVINKAEIQLSLLPAYNSSTYFAPQKLYATGIATTTYPTGYGYTPGEIYNLADRYPLFSLSPYAVIDGYPHSNFGPNNLTTYTINIPRELMLALSPTQNSDTIHLRINGTQDFYGAYHMVAAGGNYPDSIYRAKLKVVYSQLKNN